MIYAIFITILVVSIILLNVYVKYKQRYFAKLPTQYRTAYCSTGILEYLEYYKYPFWERVPKPYCHKIWGYDNFGTSDYDDKMCSDMGDDLEAFAKKYIHISEYWPYYNQRQEELLNIHKDYEKEQEAKINSAKYL